MTTPKPIVLTTLSLLGLLLIGATHAMSLIDGKSRLTSPWKERFQDVTQLNAYAKTQPSQLSGVTIENESIDGAILNGGTFQNTDWNKVSAKKTTLTKVIFRHGILEDIDFSHSTLTDVVFEDVKLRGVHFFHATLNNVRFIRCTFNGVAIDQTKNSRIEVIDSKAISTSFSEGQLIAVFRNTKLHRGVEITDLLPPSSLTFERSELIDVNMERSKLTELLVDESKFDAVLKVGAADRVMIRNSSVDTSFSATAIGALIIKNTTIKRMIFNRAKVNSLSMENCGRAKTLSMYEATIGSIDIIRCPVDDFSPVESIVGVLRIKDSAISNSEFLNMKAKTMILENVTLDGNIDFTGAQIGDLKTHNVTQQPGLKLTTTGSNVKF